MTTQHVALELEPLPEAKRELAGRDEDARRSLQALGHWMYDGGSQAALAARLTKFGERPVSQVVVNHWLSGRNSMKLWALKAMEAACVDAIEGLRARGMVLGHSVLPSIQRLIAESEQNDADA